MGKSSKRNSKKPLRLEDYVLKTNESNASKLEEDILDLYPESEETEDVLAHSEETEADVEDEEILALRAELLAEERRQQQKQKIKDSLKKRIKEVKSLSQKSTTSDGSKISEAAATPTGMNLKKSLIEVELNDFLGEDSDNSEAEPDTTRTGSIRRHKKRASGLHATASHSVVRGVKWPQTFLGPQHFGSGKPISYGKLDMRLFVIGELEIMNLADIGEVEKQARSFMLQNAIYFSGFYQWSAILKYHAAILDKIERGQTEWGENHSKFESQILHPYPLRREARSENKWDKKTFSVGKQGRVWYCAAYNSTEGCNKPDKHTIDVNGSSRVAHHICASCYINKKEKKSHAATSCKENDNE